MHVASPSLGEARSIIGGLEGNMDELPDATKDEGSAGEK